MSEHTIKHSIKEIRAQFKAQGKFHTPPELALFLRSLIDGEPKEVYDPTCGAGALLSVFPDAEKYGQDIDEEALKDAQEMDNFHGVLGDVLTQPAFLDKRFDCIVANPPFSIPWTPFIDERFKDAPCVPTKGRADYAFLLHILYMLSERGTAAVLSFPGILYRGQREAKIRRWFIEQNYIDKIIQIPSDTFTDTSIHIACLVLKKHRDKTSITFEDLALKKTIEVSFEDIKNNDFTLSVSSYIQPEIKEEIIDPVALEMQIRASAVNHIKHSIAMSRIAEVMTGLPIEPFKKQLHEAIEAA